MPPTRKGSQFAGAAAIFQQKEKELGQKNKNATPLSPTPGTPSKFTKFGNSSLNQIGVTPTAVKAKKKAASNLQAPPFVSPGAGKSRPSWNAASAFPSPSYLDKPSGLVTPLQKTKRISVSGFSFSPEVDSTPTKSPDSDNNKKNWKNTISFQAASPGLFTQKKRVSVTQTPAFSPHFGGSFLDKDASKTRKSHTAAAVAPLGPPIPNSEYDNVADIAIQVKIPDIDKIIRERRMSRMSIKLQEAQENVPEWKQKFQQREANRVAKESMKQEWSATQIQALIRRFLARARYPAILEANADKLAEHRQRERFQKRKLQACIKIQSIWRMYMPRKRYLYVRECRRRRLKNEAEIKRIKKVIKNMPKQTKAEIKELKKAHAEKKKDLKKKMKQTLKEDDKKLADIAASGKSMIDYLKNENKKLKDQQVTMKKEYQTLEKQTDILNQKGEEIARNFASLQAFVNKKKESIQKYEINSQKCRQRYLPKYRAMLKDRERHCLAEHRIGQMYKRRIERIVEMLNVKCNNPEIVFDAKEALATCQFEIESLPQLEVPESLKGQLK